MTRQLEAARRKRLGQYFTGDRLALLLAELAEASKAETVIDPMAGSGDMLRAVQTAGGGTKCLAAVELDPRAAALLQERSDLAQVALENGTAFDPARFVALGWQWDLVITNPPYVRYQNASAAQLEEVSVPSAAEVRCGLLRCIEQNPYLTPHSRSVLLSSCDYSGLADLAVPSWLLASSLVRPGGTLALVVPDTWLSREYARPVVTTLSELFDLQFVVEDREATWFGDALVRTTLVVAVRRDSAPDALRHRRVVLSSKAGQANSLVGAAWPESASPDRAFAEWVRGRGEEPRAHVTAAYDTIPSQRIGVGAGVNSALVTPVDCGTLEDLGWVVSQGLRSGANDFFYLKDLGSGMYESALLPGRRLVIDDVHLIPAIRRQSDLRTTTDSRTTDGMQAQWRLLRITDYALAEDAKLAGDRYRELDGDLELLVRTAVDAVVGNTPIPELSAVRVNARAAREKSAPRFWYQLPDLTQRHSPDLFVARVNAGHPDVYMNADRSLVIDANFTTLVRKTANSPTVHAMLAFLNSTFIRAHLETTSTVLGGGALKVEASHIRRLPIPDLPAKTWSKLSTCGKTLAGKGVSVALIRRIDDLISTGTQPHGDLGQWQAVADRALQRRTQRPER